MRAVEISNLGILAAAIIAPVAGSVISFESRRTFHSVVSGIFFGSAVSLIYTIFDLRFIKYQIYGCPEYCGMENVYLGFLLVIVLASASVILGILALMKFIRGKIGA